MVCLFVSHVDAVFMCPFTTLAKETACPLWLLSTRQ